MLFAFKSKRGIWKFIELEEGRVKRNENRSDNLSKLKNPVSMSREQQGRNAAGHRTYKGEHDLYNTASEVIVNLMLKFQLPALVYAPRKLH